MKRKALMKLLAKAGATFKEGANHTKVYFNGKCITVLPRHREIKETTAKSIIDAIK